MDASQSRHAVPRSRFSPARVSKKRSSATRAFEIEGGASSSARLRSRRQPFALRPARVPGASREHPAPGPRAILCARLDPSRIRRIISDATAVRAFCRPTILIHDEGRPRTSAWLQRSPRCSRRRNAAAAAGARHSRDQRSRASSRPGSMPRESTGLFIAEWRRSRRSIRAIGSALRNLAHEQQKRPSQTRPEACGS